MQQERNKKYQAASEALNKTLSKSLENFAHSTEWTDINNWLLNLQSCFIENPSPFIADKILLSKRLSQCMNPVLPEKVHECVLRILEIMFRNMRKSVEGNINDYVKMFAEDLGVYSVSMLPYFTHTSVSAHRIFCLKLINTYYLDLGRELIPMLPGLMKSILPVYSETLDEHLIKVIEVTLKRLLQVAGRRYVLGVTWSSILKYRDCKEGGIRFLSKVIQKMEFIKGEQEFSESRGFSEIQREIMEQMKENSPNELTGNIVNKPQRRKSLDDIRVHLQTVLQDETNQISNEPNEIVVNSESPLKQIFQPHQVDFSIETNNLTSSLQLPSFHEKPLYKINEQIGQESILSNEPRMQKSNLGAIERDGKSKQKDELFPEQQLIRLDKVPLMTSQGIELIRKNIDDDSPENNFPNSNTLVVSALISCLQEDSALIKRTTLDFMFSHLRIKSELLTEGDRLVLVQALVRLYKKKEISIGKRVNRWIFGRQNEENQYVITEKNQYVVGYIIYAFRKILQSIPKNEQNCSFPIKILQNFYIQHPHLVELTLPDISLHLLRYIFNFGTRSQKAQAEQEFAEEILKVGKRFLQNLPSYYSIIFRSLGHTFLESVRQSENHKAFEAIKYIDFCYIRLMKHEHSVEQIEYITITLQCVCKGLALLTKKATLSTLFMKDAVLLVYNLISRRESVQKYNRKEQERVNKKYVQETGEQQLPMERIVYQQQLRSKEEIQQNRCLIILEQLEIYFTRLGEIVRTQANVEQYEESFKLSSMAIVKLQQHLPYLEITQLPKWFLTIEGGIKVSNPLVSLSAIEAMIKCLMWEKKHPIYANFKSIIIQKKTNKGGTDYQKLALEKLWSLLDYPHMHSKIIDLIVGFSLYFPFEFSDTVKHSFNTHSAPDKEASIQRFSHFWRLTGCKYRDLLISNKEFVELNKVGLFRMLDFLDDQNPLVRHAAKNWLMESMSLLTRVIQPLLHELLTQCTQWYQTPKGIYLIQNAYDTNHIFSTFRRIRSILANGSYTFLRYVYQTELSDNLQQLREKVTSISKRILTVEDAQKGGKEDLKAFEREPVLPKALQNLQKVESREERMSYLDLLIVLAVKYIQGHAIQSMGVEFYVGSSGVNASAVELVETLLDYVDNPILCEKLIKFIKEYLFKVLGQSVLNCQYIMQIELLNLLKNIFFNSSFRKKGDIIKIRQFFKEVFTDKIFLRAALSGLNTPFAYVRSQFINFITVCIPLIADFLDPIDCTECIRRILVTYYQIIKDIGMSLAKNIDQDEQEEEGDIPHQLNMSMSKIIELQTKLRMEQKFIRFSDNLKQVGKTNEILSVLHGVESILNYFYDLNKLDVKNLGFQFSNPYTFFDTFKSIITLGLMSSEKRAKLVERKNFLHNFQTCEALLKDLEPVYETILRSWPLSEQFVRIGSEQFSSVGMRSFNFQRFSRYNKVVRDLIGYVESEKESIWGKIYSIMQPMFCKFPTQIIDIYLKLWIRQCTNVTHQSGRIKPNYASTELLMKIMETIIVNNFPMNIVIHAFLESTPLTQLCLHYTHKLADKKLNNVLDYAYDQKQSKLLYFLYVYFNYVHLNEKELTKEPLLQIWSLIMQSLKPFTCSRSPLAAIWIIELINLCSRKYSPKQLLVNERFKSDLHALANQKLRFLAAIASKKEVFFFGEPLGSVSFSEKQDAVKKDPYHVVLPLPPTLYQISISKKRDRNNSDSETFGQFRAGMNSQIQKRYRLYCFKILKKLGLQVLQNIYLPQKTHWVVIRACEWIQGILPTIEDKSQGNMLYAECASEIVHDILGNSRALFIKELRPKLLAIFNKDDFFICNINTLNYWAKIVDWMVSADKHSETYGEYLQKVSFSSSYFSNENVENKRRIKSFERICFILYAGGKDKYSKKIKELLKKIADVIKKPQNVHPALLILILFSIRILILRLSEIELNQLFIDIWPMILTLLMQMFSNKPMARVTVSNDISRNPNLMLAALKLIEIISLTNLGSFAHHQWIFICDYFGARITVNEISSELTQHFSHRAEVSHIIQTDIGKNPMPFIYRPFLMNYSYSNFVDYVPHRDEEAKVEFKANKRIIIVKDSFIQDDSELKIHAMLLMQYLAYISEYRTETDWTEVEEVIVNDFINLDKFIHKIS